MFISIVDMIEDVMAASLAAVPMLEAVKVEDFTIGKNALRIVSFRALPDQPHEKDYPKEEWIDQGSKEDALDPNRRELSEEQEKKKEAIETEGASPEDEDQTGELFGSVRRRASRTQNLIKPFLQATTSTLKCTSLF